MEIKRFGNPAGKTMMLLHGNLMCWRQFEDVIPLLAKEYLVFAVSFDGFDGTGKTTYTNAQDQADKLADYVIENCGGNLDLVFAESLGCGPAIFLEANRKTHIGHMILSGPEYLDFGILNGLLLKIMPQKQYRTAREKSMPAWALKFMGQTQEGMRVMLDRVPEHISLESIHATWEVGLNLYPGSFFGTITLSGGIILRGDEEQKTVRYIMLERQYPRECAKERQEMGRACVEWIENIWK